MKFRHALLIGLSIVGATYALAAAVLAAETRQMPRVTGRDMIPPPKFTPPAAVVVSQCSSIIAVGFTDESGNLTDFPLADLSLASVLLFIGKAGTVLRYDIPCGG